MFGKGLGFIAYRAWGLEGFIAQGSGSKRVLGFGC